MTNKKPVDDDETLRQQIGGRLREAREFLGFSQDEVTKHLGIPRSALSHIESGQRRVEALELKKLADLYRQPLAYFTDGESKDETFSSDVTHLARSAAQLSAKDREELARFAEFLRTRASSKDRKK